MQHATTSCYGCSTKSSQLYNCIPYFHNSTSQIIHNVLFNSLDEYFMYEYIFGYFIGSLKITVEFKDLIFLIVGERIVV